MHQEAPTAFDEAVDRYRAAEREFTAASAALRGLLTKNNAAAQELRVTMQLPAAPGVMQRIDLGIIQTTVAAHFGIHPSLMKSAERPNHIAHPRQVAMLLARELTRHCLEEIGDAFGGRDHGTVIHACRAVANRAELDDAFRAELEQIRAAVRAALGLTQPVAANA
jgi:chromosomal replication initiation ATPase DnaA